MDDLDRPNLSLDAEEQINLTLHQQDVRFWPLIKQFQIATPETQRVAAQFVFNEGPLPPKRPQQLAKTIAAYADALFYAEASQYPPLHENFARWLQKLSKRVEARTLIRVSEVEAGNPLVSIAYHGLSEDAMRSAVRDVLQKAVNKWPQTASSETPLLQDGEATQADKPTNPRREFVDPILDAKGWSPLVWAAEADLAYHTVADYLTGKDKAIPRHTPEDG
jgi:hypothetical protein